MEHKTIKSFKQKVTYDPKLNGLEKKIKSPVKEQKFNEMVNRSGEKKLKKELLTGRN
jgi:hypothetical protein